MYDNPLVATASGLTITSGRVPSGRKRQGPVWHPTIYRKITFFGKQAILIIQGFIQSKQKKKTLYLESRFGKPKYYDTFSSILLLFMKFPHCIQNLMVQSTPQKNARKKMRLRLLFGKRNGIFVTFMASLLRMEYCDIAPLLVIAQTTSLLSYETLLLTRILGMAATVWIRNLLYLLAKEA